MLRRSHALFFLVGLVLGASPALAQEQTYALSTFDVTVQVRPDGSYEVDESITYDFQQGTFSRAYRSVVRKNGGAIRDVRVTSPDTPVDSVWVGKEDGTRQVRWVFPERSAPAQFDLRYVLEDAIYERGSRNVVQLDVMAGGAVVLTRDVDVQVGLPFRFDVHPGQVTLDPATGTVGREAGQLVATFRRDRVEAGDEYSVEMSFPKQVTGEFLPTVAQLLMALLLVVLGGGAGGLAAWAWRGPRPEEAARRPPEALDLPTAVALLQVKEGTAFLAVLFDLVRRGHVTLRHDREDRTIGSDEVVRLDVHPDRADLSDFEQRFVDELRGYETIDDFWSDTSSFRSDEMDARREALFDRGWMRSHALRSNLLLGGAVLVFVGGLVMVIVEEGVVPFFLFFGGLGVGTGCLIAAVRRQTWTETGARRGMALRSYLDHEKSEVERLRETSPARAAERLVESLPWLLLHDEVSTSWIEETKEALDGAEASPELPDGFVSLVADQEDAGAPVAAFTPLVAVMGAVESSSTVGAAGAAGAGGAAGGGAGAAGAA